MKKWWEPATIRLAKYNYMPKKGIEHHQCPDWMPKKLHLKTEAVLSPYSRRIWQTRFGRVLYHLLFGIICDFSLKEIRDYVYSSIRRTNEK